jgi:hypothetical protein
MPPAGGVFGFKVGVAAAAALVPSAIYPPVIALCGASNSDHGMRSVTQQLFLRRAAGRFFTLHAISLHYSNWHAIYFQMVLTTAWRSRGPALRAHPSLEYKI